MACTHIIKTPRNTFLGEFGQIDEQTDTGDGVGDQKIAEGRATDCAPQSSSYDEPMDGR